MYAHSFKLKHWQSNISGKMSACWYCVVSTNIMLFEAPYIFLIILYCINASHQLVQVTGIWKNRYFEFNFNVTIWMAGLCTSNIACTACNRIHVTIVLLELIHWTKHPQTPHKECNNRIPMTCFGSETVDKKIYIFQSRYVCRMMDFMRWWICHNWPISIHFFGFFSQPEE